ncbi:MAG: metallophosphoesterase, partial [bacterium]
IVYGTKPGGYTLQTPLQTFAKDKPNEIVLRKLLADTRYYYQLRIRPAVGAQLTTSPEYTFHTQRVPGEAYTFTITADSHLDERTTPSLYLQTMHNALADKPDFHIDLGDTFMTEKYPSRDSAAKQYLAQRYYFGQLCHSAPLYLVIGNHDGETVKEQDGTANSLAVWSATMRKTYFPNPVPDTFYTGNETKNQLAGDLQDYYAWTWGDAQFIMLDPYWFTPSQRGGNDNWTRTLGNTQYQWLTKTLENSKSKYKFVFIHHLVGGLGKDARGGIEAAPFYEWGGKNTDGTDGFAAHRPGWTMPIHQLLLKNHVSAVFHGHDHLFAKQELDGIIYQEVPQPGWQGRYDSRRATEYGYEKGEILGSSGHLRLTVSGKETKVEYVSAMLPTDENNTRKNGMVVSSYFVMP